MATRDAIDTIKGYFYQFDYAILQLLQLNNDSDTITVEGTEDIDIDDLNTVTAIQCKYYSKTEYNHSVISKPIRLMLNHYKDVKAGLKPRIKYKLYGNYKSGQEKLEQPFDINYLKEKFLTYKEKGVECKHHEKLGLDDTDLSDFINLLEIDINAKPYEEQHSKIIERLREEFSCDVFEAEYYFYNSALNEIKKLSTEEDENLRRVSRENFISKINKKEILFNKWFVRFKGKEAYFKALKSEYFTELNKESYERFFTIDLAAGYTIQGVKELIHIISKKFSNLSKRNPNPYCPYIYLHGITEEDLVVLKKLLYTERFTFIDGHPFNGSGFIPQSIIIEANFQNQIKVKVIDKNIDVNNTLNVISKTKYVYQFYTTSPYLTGLSSNVRIVNIQIEEFNNIKQIV